MKRLTYALIGMLLTFCVTAPWAQDISWSKPLEGNSKKYSPDIIGENEEEFYVLSSRRKDLFLESYSKENFKRKFKKVVTLPEKKGFKTQRVATTVIGDKVVVFYTFYKKKLKENALMAYTIDLKTGKKNKDDQKLFDIVVEKSYRKGSFRIVKNEANTRFLMTYTGYFKKKKKYVVNQVIFDEDMNELYTLDEEFEKDMLVVYGQMTLDQDGSLYYLRTDLSDNSHYVGVLDANAEWEKWENRIEDHVELKGSEMISHLQFNINKNNDLNLLGYYSKESDGPKKKFSLFPPKRDLKGCFFLRVDPESKEIQTATISEFDKEFQESFKTEKDEKKGREAAVPNGFNKVEIIDKADGGVIVLGELYLSIHRCTRNGCYGIEYFGDVVAMNLDPEGNLIWAKRIPKVQKWQYQTMSIFAIGTFGVRLVYMPLPYDQIDYLSYVSSYDDKNLYLIFNENPKNLGKDMKEKWNPMTKAKKAVAIQYSIDMESGEVSKGVQPKADQLDVKLKPLLSYRGQTEEDIVIFGSKGKVQKFGIIRMEKAQLAEE